MRKLYFITLLLPFFLTGKVLANIVKFSESSPEAVSYQQAPVINVSATTGRIFGCVGSASASPNIQQVTVSGSSLTGDITISAPSGFEISTNLTGGFASSLTLAQSGGVVTTTIIYVRSAASDPAGAISGNIVLSSAGATNVNVAVSGIVNALPGLNAVSNQTVNNNTATAPINFTGTANLVNWTNSAPGVGLPATGIGNIPSFTAANVSNAPVTATITATPGSAATAYLPNFYGNDVIAVNTGTGKVVANIGVGTSPYGVVPSPDGSRVYVSNQVSNIISVINTATNAVVSTIAAPNAPQFLAISPDGSKLFITCLLSGNVTIMSTVTGKTVATINVGISPDGLAITPDGSKLYVANYANDNIVVIDVASNAVTATIAGGINPIGVAISPNGQYVYVSNAGDNTVSVISTGTNTIVSTIPVGAEPEWLAVTPDNGRIYVDNFTANTVSVINATTNTVIATIGVGTNPQGLSINPEGTAVYVANFMSKDISVINTSTNTVTSTISTGGFAFAYGNFIAPGSGCTGAPITFTISVNQGLAIVTSAATGNITSCVGTASSSPYIEHFTVSGNSLTGNITATAPAGFEISTVAGSGYGNSLVLSQSGGSIASTAIYVRSAASAPPGNISGNVSLTSAGVASQSVAVTATINALPTVNKPANQTVTNGSSTVAVNFTGTANAFNWVNSNPAIGLAASGTGSIPAFTGVNTISTPITATITVSPSSVEGLAYVANNIDGTVSAINIATNAVVATIPVGINPGAVTVSPDGSRAYVSNISSNTVSIISTTSNTVIATVNVGNFPFGIAISPDGSKVYVANLASNSISVISSATNTVTATITGIYSPECIAINSDGSKIYVSSYGNTSSVFVINTATNSIAANITVGSGPFGLVLSPDGSKLYVANQYAKSISIINTATNAVSATISLLADPISLAISADGSQLYVANFTPSGLMVINTSTKAMMQTVTVGSNPEGLSLSADGSMLYVLNSNSNNVSVINTQTNAVVSTIAVGKGPSSAGGNFITGQARCPGTPVTFTITVNPTSLATITSNGTLSALGTVQGTASQSATFTVSGTNMTAGILVTPPSGYEVSLDGTNYTPTVTVGTSGTIPLTTVYIRLAANAASGSYSGNIVLTSAGATPIDLATVSSTVTPQPSFTASQAAGSISACTGTASFSPDLEEFTVSGSYLSGNIVATAPSGFEISLTSSSGYSNSITLKPNNGTVSNSSIYVRSAASNSPGNITGNVTITSNGTSTQNIAVSATIYPLLTINPVSDQTFMNSVASTPINFISGANVSWVNSTPGIGLPAKGSGNIASFTPVNNTNSPIKATITATPVPYGFAYITNYGSDNVSILNTATNTIVATVAVGPNPEGVAVSPDGSRVYVANYTEIPKTDNSVSVIDARTNAVISTVKVGLAPVGLCTTPDGNKVYVANYLSNNVSVIDAISNTVVATIAVGAQPSGVLISSDGKIAYISNTFSNTVSVISTSTNTVTATINVGTNPRAESLSPDNKILYVANTYSHDITVINTATNTAITTIPIVVPPVSMAISPDGSKLYLGGQLTNVAVVNTSTYAVIANINIGSHPYGVSISPDGSRIYATEQGTSSIVVIDAATYKVITTTKVGLGPFGFGNFVGAGIGCPGTPITFTITVNPTNLILPTSNFKLAITSATCKGSNDGSISITADQNLNYTATITGNGLNAPYPFTTSTTINNLAAGTYHVCITVDGQANFQQCYDAVISEPQDLSVYSTVDDATKTITLAMTGGNQYNIQLNGVNYQTTQSSMTLALADGNNDLTVTTDKLCQGTLQKVINISGKISPYPVPFQNTLYLNLGNTVSNNVAVEIHDVSTGKMVYTKQFGSQSGVLQLDVTNLCYGAYVLHLSMDQTEKIFKIIKK